ncbi:beta-1,4-galactosyltransferase 1-like protein [Chrysochromulina parva virus BQ2]|uniref:Beta-1,4-galactosyltransferase 1-like protein n=1 Tax=Chrysochromulina parva virus BQ2 TaxID=3070831 RepID=A0A4Y6GSY5_9VIRU|nr:beta-1,4-galactosyltransferase 1-like protein [Chrysochromulina parva virus]QDF45900.1 beta-1,4-galactosyltransferase 1-like protein [Chrysochromulina parva virus BQ2]
METIPKIIFIVPYRDRAAEKIHFSVYMKYIMEDYDKNDYEIYYSHQMDSRPFNRGATKNIGFLVMKKKYPNDYKNITFVFNDIDTVPIKKNMFNYITTSGVVKHFYGFTYTLGGIFSIVGSDFEKCNGFPNNWGWGMEDNVMNERVLLNEFIINREQFFPRNSKAVLHLFDTPERLINNREPENYLKKNFNDNLNSLHEINYIIVPNNESSTSTENNVLTHDNTIKNIKVSTIEQKEYMINISNFRTFVNPANEIFYTQNTFYDGTLKPKVHETNEHRKRWGMHNYFL